MSKQRKKTKLTVLGTNSMYPTFDSYEYSDNHLAKAYEYLNANKCSYCEQHGHTIDNCPIRLEELMG